MADILIAYEQSQVITEAFINAGYNAISCDLFPGAKGLPHYQGDIKNIINKGFTLVIGHPPCTRLTNSVWWYILRNGLQNEVIQAAKDFNSVLNCNAKKICAENPVMNKLAREYVRKYDQTIQPYQFGENASKRTALWLHELPLLKPTEYYPPQIINGRKIWGNQTAGGWNKLPPDPKGKEGLRAILRAKTYPGIARAIVEQWGPLL
jgi:hypothetical protein